MPTSREDLNARLDRLRGITDEVEIDMVDGRFAAPATWPYSHPDASIFEGDDPFPELNHFKFIVDLMVEEPEPAIEQWVRAGASRITVHAETTHRLPDIIRNFQVKYGHDKGFATGLLSFGLAINIGTDTSLIEPYLDRCDYVQFMSIARIGKQGEPFDERVLPKIHAFHRKYPDMPIQADGGVSRATAQRLIDVGASRFIVGSALWNAPDMKAEMQEFSDIAETHGLYS